MTHKSQKIQLRACSALLNFLRGLFDFEPTSLELQPYYPQILSQLSLLFQNQTCYPLLEEVLITLSQVAELMKEDFSQYYNTFMPGLKSLL